ncbi:fatty acid desaturase family protein [Nesterenkonia halotolerans]|uniref:Fatty acid desaturase n=1 Tax=Nesterenkonia halotolerans TaxID=225325 RepID=A0ABR9J8N9_9MICC|nr:acyl-CoA desaturase [Nesterenkonia halotolerans]MBE1515362.1 fatty acid desaturase [Nesterenkonia halotolerans]
MTVTQTRSESARTTSEQARPPRNKQVNEFFELAQRVKDEGLMDRGASSYVLRVIVLSFAFAGAFVAMFTLGDSLWQLAVAAFFGILLTQVAFLSHDGAHQQVFRTGKRNEWFGRVTGNLIVGLSYAWWTKKHGKHHANPNTIGKDGDIAPGALVFVAEDAAQRTGFMGWLARRQGWMFFPLLTLFAIALHYNALKTVFTAKKLKRRKTELAMLAVRLIGFPVLIFLAMSPGLALGFLAVQLVVFGVYMGGSFAPNHKGMPIIPKDSDMDFLRRQVLTSRNIKGGRMMDVAMGGLNLQVEHHLFPRMPSPNLHKVKPIVEEFCAEKGISYTATGLVQSYGMVVTYLNRVGLGYADPMDCPIMAQYRPR